MLLFTPAFCTDSLGSDNQGLNTLFEDHIQFEQAGKVRNHYTCQTIGCKDIWFTSMCGFTPDNLVFSKTVQKHAVEVTFRYKIVLEKLWIKEPQSYCIVEHVQHHLVSFLCLLFYGFKSSHVVSFLLKCSLSVGASSMMNS